MHQQDKFFPLDVFFPSGLVVCHNPVLACGLTGQAGIAAAEATPTVSVHDKVEPFGLKPMLSNKIRDENTNINKI